MDWKQLLKTNYSQVCLIFAAFTLLVALGGYTMSRVIRNATAATVNVALDESEKTIRAYLREPKIAFDNIYRNVVDLLERDESQEAILTYLERTTEILRSQESGITGFLHVYGLIRNEFLSGTEHEFSDEFIPQQRPWYQLAIRSRGSEFTAPYTDVITMTSIISLSQEIYCSDGNFYGVLGLDVEVSWLIDYATSLQFVKGGYGMILNQFLFTIAHPNERYKDRPLHSLGGDYEEVTDILRMNRALSGKIMIDSDNQRVIVFFKQLYNDWFIGVVMPLRSYYSDLYWSISILIGLGFICALTLSYILLKLSKEKMQADAESKNKSSFLSLISHEMRTPLNAIIGITQLQLQNDNLANEYAGAFEKINSSGNTLLGIINDILDLAKIETGKMELNLTEYSVPDLINDVVQINYIRIGSKPLEMIVEVDQNIPTKLYGDELRLKQIINNLLSNAIKYSNEGYVKLIINSSKLPYIDESGISDSEQPQFLLQIKVEDSGQGMKPEDVKKLFSEYIRFNTKANKSTEGTGIGLNITKKLVEMMNGTIEAESEYGRGSVFSVNIIQYIVTKEIIGEEVALQLKEFSFARQNNYAIKKFQRIAIPEGKVLIVDDVETNIYVAKGLLALYELQIDTAQSGFIAIEKVQNGNEYDIIFMDHMMPQMDGIETTRKLREMGYDKRIVALTANALTGNADKFLQQGFDDFISKPIDTIQLDNIINNFIGHKASEEKNIATPTKNVNNQTFLKYPDSDYSSEERGKGGELNAELIEIILRDSEKCIEILQTSMECCDIKLFTTNAHAMKSILANMDENVLAEQAFELEKAGLEGNIDFMKEHAPAFIQHLQDLVLRLKLPDETIQDDEPIKEDIHFLNEQLLIIQNACEEYDETKALATLDLLNQRTWKNTTKAELKKIRETLYLHSNFEEAASLCDNLMIR